MRRCELLSDLVHEGKVRMLGASNYDGRRLRATMEVSRNAGWAAYGTLQPNYNLHTREQYERDLAPVVAEFGLGVVPYFSLAAGFLTGKYTSLEDSKAAHRAGTVAKYFDERGLRILAALRKLSAETGATPAALSLAWLISRPNILAPIASATKTEQLEDMFAAAELQLEPEQISALSAASAYDSLEHDPAMAGALPTGA